jgi:hypothetical protein
VKVAFHFFISKNFSVESYLFSHRLFFLLCALAIFRFIPSRFPFFFVIFEPSIFFVKENASRKVLHALLHCVSY